MFNNGCPGDASLGEDVLMSEHILLFISAVLGLIGAVILTTTGLIYIIKHRKFGQHQFTNRMIKVLQIEKHKSGKAMEGMGFDAITKLLLLGERGASLLIQWDPDHWDTVAYPEMKNQYTLEERMRLLALTSIKHFHVNLLIAQDFYMFVVLMVISISDIVASIGFLLAAFGGIIGYYSLFSCVVQAILIQIGGLSQIISQVMLVIVSFLRWKEASFSNLRRSVSALPLVLVLTNSFALLIVAFFACFARSPSIGWCWIYQSASEFPWIKFVCFYAWLLLALFISWLMVFYVLKKEYFEKKPPLNKAGNNNALYHQTRSRQLTNSIGDRDFNPSYIIENRDEALSYNTTNTTTNYSFAESEATDYSHIELIVYTCIFTLVWGTNLFNHVLDLSGVHDSTFSSIFIALISFCNPLQGALNAIFYWSFVHRKIIIWAHRDFPVEYPYLLEESDPNYGSINE